MKISEILPGSKVDISLIQAIDKSEVDVGVEDKVYISSVYDVYEDGIIEITVPTKKQVLQLLPKHIRYEFLFSMDTGRYKAEGIIEEHIKKGNFYLFRVKITTPLKKVQRREYYRLECLMPTMFLALDEKAVECKTITEVLKYMNDSPDMKVRGMGTILDISGGGARFVTANSLQDISYLLMQFQIVQENEKNDIEVVAKLVHSERMPDDNKFVHRVKFFFKDNMKKEKIISYIFEEERRIRKKEQGL